MNRIPQQPAARSSHPGSGTINDRLLPSRARAAAALLVTAALLLLVVACGGGAPPAGAGASATGGSRSRELAFSECMRSNGVPSFPDPSGGGRLPKETPQQLGVSSARLQAAQRSCVHLLPNGGSGPDQAQVQQARAQALVYARCMRSHGVPLPDPDSTGRIPDPAASGIDQGSPRFEAANQACGRYRPAYIPSNASYNSWARSHGCAGSAWHANGC